MAYLIRMFCCFALGRVFQLETDVAFSFPEKSVDPLVTWVFWGCSFVATKTWPISWKWYLRFWSEDCESISLFQYSLTLSCLLTLTDFLYLLWHYWLVVSTHLKNISQIGPFPQVGVKIKNIWNHHLDYLFIAHITSYLLSYSFYSTASYHIVQ